MEVWAVARYDLRLTDAEIGKLTLRQYDALVARKKANDNRTRYDAAIVAAAVYNASIGEFKISPLDFVPDLKALAARGEADLTTMSPEEQQRHLLNLFGAKTIRQKG